jgi:hypothetical protein
VLAEIKIKYVDDIIATVAQDVTAWELLDDIESFDYSWRPNPTDPPYIYVFGNQWLTPEQRPALQYVVPVLLKSNTWIIREHGVAVITHDLYNITLRALIGPGNRSQDHRPTTMCLAISITQQKSCPL